MVRLPSYSILGSLLAACGPDVATTAELAELCGRREPVRLLAGDRRHAW
jgi:hypothetical protein